MSEENKKKTFRVTCTDSPKEPSILRQYKRAIAGFALAPILYIIALAGIAGTVLFTGYTQILRSNVEITADNSVRNQIRMATEVIAAQSSVNNIANELVVPANAVVALNTLDAARLPRNAAGTAAITEAVIQGSALAVGGVAPQGGIRQLDPWGRYFVMCRWTGSTSAPQTGPSMSIISAGADGNLATTCDDTAPAAGSDDKLEYMTVANVLSRSANWQAQAMAGNRTGYTFGIDPNSSVLAVGVDAASVDTSKSLDIGGDSRFRGNLLVNQGLTVNGTTALQTLTATTTTLGATTLTTLSASTVNSSGGISGASLNVSGTSTLADVTGGAASFTSTAGGAISGSTLNLSGLATLGSGLSVTGATTLGDLTAGSSTLGATMASSVSTGDLTATGTTTLASATVTGNATVGGTITAAGGFIGNLTGNVTGNVSGSAGSVDAGDITGVVPRSAGGTGVSATDMANLRQQMGLAIGTNVQAWDSDLQALADASSTGFIRRTDVGVLSIGPIMPAEVPAFAGAAPGVAGTLGGVPIAAAGQHTYLLRGDGTWFNPGSLSVGGIGQGDSGVGVTDTGVGVITFTIDGFEQARITGVASADRSVRLTGGNSGGNIPPEIGAYTTAPNSPLRLASQGTGDLILRTNGIDRLTVNGATGITSGSFSGPLAGNATTATTLQTARNFSLTGDATATAVSFNGSADVALATTVAKLQGRDVAATLPNTGQALVWNGTAWAPGPAGTPDGGTLGSTTGVDVRLKDGTAPLPSLTFALDTDTGIYRPANNEFGITAGGVQRVLVAGDANDSVLRIQKPAGGTGAAVLRLTDAAAGADLKSVELRNQNGDFVLRALNDNGSTKGDRLYLKNNGFIGLGGVTDPKQLLHLAGVLRFDTDALTPCDPDAAGAIRWSGAAIEYCDGVGPWAQFASGGGGGGGDAGALFRVVDATGANLGTLLSVRSAGSSSTDVLVYRRADKSIANLASGSFATYDVADVYFTGANCTGTAYFYGAVQAQTKGLACTGAARCTAGLVRNQNNYSNPSPTSLSRRTTAGYCVNGTTDTSVYSGHSAVADSGWVSPTCKGISSTEGLTANACTIEVDTSNFGGGTTVPAGNDTEIQFNDGGVWGADDQFVWNKTNDILSVGGSQLSGGSFFLAGSSDIGAIGMAGSAAAANRTALNITGTASTGVITNIAVRTNNANRIVINNNGNVTIAAPSSGVALAITGDLTVSGNASPNMLVLGNNTGATCSGGTNAGAVRYNAGTFQQCNGASWATLGSGSAAAGGSNTQVQFNNSNALAGSANFTWNNGTNTLAASNLTVATAFTASGTSNFVGLISGNGKEMFNTGDTYLRINQSGAFSAGVWLANSNIAGGSGIWAMGSNGGTTNSRVYINGGTYNGTNVISLDGSNGNVALAGVLTVANQINSGGALSTYGAVTINGAKGGWSGINFRSGGTNWKTLMINNSISGVYNAADNAWDYYWTGGTLTQGTIPAANVAAGTFGAGNFVFQGIVDANSQIRSPIFYDLNNGAYYVDPASTSYVNTFTGLDFRSDIWYDRNNTGYYIDGNNSSNLNVLTVNGALYTGEWVRVATSAGIYWTAYGGGWHMTDSTYLRAYNGKYVLAAGYYHTSDARMKHDIRPFRTTGLSVVDGLRTVHFKWNTDNKDDLGVIAQETEKVLPEAVHTDEKGFKQVQYDKLVLPIIEAVKELHALVKKLVTDMIETRTEVAKLKAELASQQADFTARLEALEQTCRAANDNDPAETAKQKRSSTSR